MAWSIKRRTCTAIALIALMGGMVFAFPVVAPAVRSTNHFVSLETEPRVRYEPGAERNAKIIAQALPSAISRVEAGHMRAFPKPIVVYVCATEKSFERYRYGAKGGGGFVYGARLFISPKPQNTAERLPSLTTHELSHLHLEQTIGIRCAAGSVPGWFKEGLAVHVSNGAGAENVSEAEARAAIMQGRVFRRDSTGSFLFPQSGARDGLPVHLFYRESGMFVEFLARRSSAGFERLLQGIQDRKNFGAAVRESYGRDLSALWDEFIAEIKARPELTRTAKQ